MPLGASWYRGKEVTARDFFDFESYVFARARLLPGDCAGVQSLHLQQSLEASLSSNNLLSVRVERLSGVTDRGHPVVLEDDEGLESSLRLESVPVEVDLSIGVNPQDPALLDEHPTGPPKLILRVGPRLFSEKDAMAGGVLHLGRYGYHPDEGLTLVRRPRVRVLGALLPHDDAWAAWVQPLRKAVEDRLGGLRDLVLTGSWNALSWAGLLGRLGYEWPFLSVEEVARRAVQIKWLSEGGSLDALPGRGALPGTPLVGAELEGEDLPRYLAHLMGLRLKPILPVHTGDKPEANLMPNVELKWLPPSDLLARFGVELEGRKVALCIPMDAAPPPELQVRGGGGPAGFRVKETLVGEIQEGLMLYRLLTPPRQGETFRFSPVDVRAQKAVYVTW